MNPEPDEFMAEQLRRLSEAFGSPIDLNEAASPAEPQKKEKRWFEPPAPPVKPPEVPKPVEVAKTAEVSNPVEVTVPPIVEAPQPATDYQVVEKAPSEDVELPVVSAAPAVQKDPPASPSKPGEGESSVSAEPRGAWRRLWDRLREL